MSRLVRHDATGPALVKVGEKTIAVCQCGLSKSKPFCDGAHKATHDEKSGLVYIYDHERKRIDLFDEFPTPTKTYEK